MNDICKIRLQPLLRKSTYPGYSNTALSDFFGSTGVTPALSFSRSEFFTEGKRYVKGMSISGVQQKLSLKVDKKQIVITDLDGKYILKPSPEAFPYAAENEHVAMIIGQTLKIPTAKCGLIAFKGEPTEYAYICKRFDRDSKGGKLDQEDLLQIMDKPSVDKYQGTYETAGKTLFEAVNGKLIVIQDFIHRIIFAYLIGNSDLHLKNFSVTRASRNKSRFYDKLTPNYDVLFCDAYKDLESSPGFLALGLLEDESDPGEEQFSRYYEKYGFYIGDDFVELGIRLGLRAPVIIRFIEKIKSKQENILKLIDRSFMPNEMKSKAKTIVRERSKALLLYGKYK